jgi:hypothetical protein
MDNKIKVLAFEPDEEYRALYDRQLGPDIRFSHERVGDDFSEIGYILANGIEARNLTEEIEGTDLIVYSTPEAYNPDEIDHPHHFLEKRGGDGGNGFRRLNQHISLLEFNR